MKLFSSKIFKIGTPIILSLVLLGFALPEKLVIPVVGATPGDWNHDTFWYEPWGISGVHKGIDIFATQGSTVLSSVNGIVIYKGNLPIGGKVVIVLGPKWRLHYFAHLDEYLTHFGDFVSSEDVIAKVGTSGNAKGKPPHLHYSIFSLIPYPWRWDSSRQGMLKMFFLNPSEQLLADLN